MRSTIYLKWVNWNQFWNSRNAPNKFRREYLIPDATTNDFGVLGLLITNGTTTVHFRAGLRFDNRKK
jgi:hypothetical protein